MQPSEHISYDRGFRTLFEDGVHLLMACEREQDNDMSNSLARGSIACTMMLPEVAANICIESLGLEPSVFRDIDKLSPLAKFDFYLRTNFRAKKLPAGVLPAQKAQELKRLRDAFVHPKKHPVVWVETEVDTVHGSSKRTQFMDMSENPSMWYSFDAEQAMRGAHDFLAFFFLDLCGFTKKKTTALLFSDEPEINSGSGDVYYYGYAFQNALQEWGINTSYFRMGTL